MMTGGVKMMMLNSSRGVGGYPRRYKRVAGTRLRSLFPSGRRPSVGEESEAEREESEAERGRERDQSRRPHVCGE